MLKAKGYRTTKECLSFADDFLTLFDNIADLLDKIEILKNWSKQFKLKINNTKSGILFRTAQGHK